MKEVITENQATAKVVPVTPLPKSIEEILHSKSFALAPALRGLLLYLWNHREEALSEYAVAVEALGRPADFDPKLDATVRVQVSRLRQRLDKYYRDEGQTATERLVIPLGSHQLRVEAIVTALTVAPAAAPPAPPTELFESCREHRRLIRTLVLGCVALTLVCGGLGVALVRARATLGREPVLAPSRFWKRFFANGHPTRVVLPSPVFFSFNPHGMPAIMIRDTRLNDLLAADSSKAITAARKLFGAPHFAQNYTVTSDTFAAFHLARYLESRGLDSSLHSISEAPLDVLDEENMIAIGTRGTLNPLKPYFDRMSVRTSPGDYDVEIDHPSPGEPALLSMKTIAGDRGIYPGVIGVLPGRNGRTRLLVLTALHTSSLVAFLTSANGQGQLDRIWEAHGSPEYFEVILQAEMNGNTLVRFWPVLLRPIPAA